MDDTQRTGWQKRILLFLTSQCITLFGSTLVQMHSFGMQPCKHPAACGWLHLQSVPICRNFSFHL